MYGPVFNYHDADVSFPAKMAGGGHVIHGTNELYFLSF